jgi:magnesium chelatase subunit D
MQTLEKIQPNTNHLPFAAVVGHTSAKQAMLLLGIEPRLGGLAFAAYPGTAKTTLARSFHELLPEQTVIASCGSHCDPAQSRHWCSECRQKFAQVAPQTVSARPPFVNLPLNVTEDRLLGGLALEATLQQGRRVAERGLLAEANRGVLYCDELNLLDDGAGNYLMDALSRGWLALEREGLSAEYPTEFFLLGTFNPAEGDLRPGLLDRIGLIVSASALDKPEARAEIMRRALRFDRRPTDVHAEYADETEFLRQAVASGREILPQVQISDEQLLALSEIALRLGVPGNRADLLAMRAARASAALSGRTSVDEEDLKLAIQLVLLPRATRLPEPEQEQEPEQPPPPPEQNEQPENEEDNNDDEDNQPPEPPEPQPPQLEDLLLSAVATEVPEDILSLVNLRQQRAKAGSRGEALNWKRGRHIRSVAGKPGQGRIAIIDTLRAAAPFQNIRKAENRKSVPSVQIRADDLRLKRYKDKAGVLFIFVVDASGSMALNRMREAKGAVTQLLQQAYVHRDKVALVSFRGREAEVLLPPSQSVELAKRSLDVLPTGGGTPLASALMTSLNLSQQARRVGINKTMLVLITDGRGNVLLKEDDATATLSKDARKNQAAEEVAKLANAVAIEGISAVVLDTQTNFLSKGEAAQLARNLGARYIYLPRADARAIAANVSNAAEDLR